MSKAGRQNVHPTRSSIKRHIRRLKRPFEVTFIKLNGKIRNGVFSDPVFYDDYFKAVEDTEDVRTIVYDRIVKINKVDYRPIWSGPLPEHMPNEFVANEKIWKRVGNLYIGEPAIFDVKVAPAAGYVIQGKGWVRDRSTAEAILKEYGEVKYEFPTMVAEGITAFPVRKGYSIRS